MKTYQYNIFTNIPPDADTEPDAVLVTRTRLNFVKGIELLKGYLGSALIIDGDYLKRIEEIELDSTKDLNSCENDVLAIYQWDSRGSVFGGWEEVDIH